MENRISPPWMQEGANDNSQPEMVVVHMQPGELEGLDNLQGGPSIDPETGIREYSALAEIIEIPEVKDIFKRVSQELDNHGDISPDMREIYESAAEHSLPYVAAPEEKNNPLKRIEHEGREGDTKLALIPLNLAMFLIELRHEPSINPKTGLLEFKWKLKKIFKPITKFVHSVVKNPIRTAGTIAGALLGGPVGMGIGNTIGGVASGKPIKKALMTGLQVGGLGYGLQGVGQAAGLSSATPYTGGFFGGGPNLVAQGLGKIGIGSAAATPAATAGSAAAPAGMMAAGAHGPKPVGGLPSVGSSHVYYPETFVPASAGYGEYAGPLAMGAGAGMINMRGNQPQSGMSSGNSYMESINNALLDMLKNPATYATLGMTGLAYKGSERQHKREKKAEKEASGKLERERERMGFYEPWRPVTASRRRRNPRFGSESDLHSRYGIGYEPAFLDEEEGYARGGSVRTQNLIKGPGKGQDDKIKTSVPDGTYIEDASSTSMFGDGSSEAGAKILKEFEKKINGNFSKKIPRNNSKVPVWLSNGEYAFSPETVTKLGRGSNARGADILKKMTINLRRHKASHGGGLPPKAKPPAHYIPGMR